MANLFVVCKSCKAITSGKTLPTAIPSSLAMLLLDLKQIYSLGAQERVDQYSYKSICIPSTVLVEYFSEQRFSHHNTLATRCICYLQVNFKWIGIYTKHAGKYISCNTKSERKEFFCKDTEKYYSVF